VTFRSAVTRWQPFSRYAPDAGGEPTENDQEERCHSKEALSW
jgi:hypothetical protein